MNLVSPALPLFLAVPALFLWRLWTWHTRTRLLRAFVERHGLSTEPSSTAVDPGIRGEFFEATYPLWLEGVFEDVSVVAFDYMLGMGRNRKRGSGVGVRRRVLAAEPMAAGFHAVVREEWTFVYDSPGIVLNSGMDPAEMEHLWSWLLRLPALDEAGAP